MIQLIKINLVKKINKTTLIYFMLSILFIVAMMYYYSYDITKINIKMNKAFYINGFVLNNISLILFLGVFFSLLLALLELHKNVNNFDAYFVCSNGKVKYIIAKLLAFIMIIFIFSLIVTLAFSIVLNYAFYYDFKIKLLLYLFGFLLRYFLLAFFFVILTRNIFSIIIPITIFLLKNITFKDSINKVTKYIFLDLKFVNNDFFYNVDNLIVWIINGLLLVSIVILYLVKDIKC